LLILGLAVAGAIGAPARYLLDRAVSRRVAGARPVGTLMVNVSGSLVLGFIAGLALYHGLTSTPKTIVGTGFCGAYTTFSTFTYESLRLVEYGEVRTATENVGVSLVLQALAAALGMALAAL